MVITLLPAEHEAPACAPFTRELGASPAGTGLELDRVVVVAEAGPWPKPALRAPRLKPLVAPLTASPVSTRLFAAEPADGMAPVEVYERDGLGASVASFAPETAADRADPQAWIERTIAQIGETPYGMLNGEPAAPVLLVCTQGTHDGCCGVHGEALAQLIESDHPGVALRRVSHTGGHRFAPTMMALPTGRMWAWVDGSLLGRVLDGQPTAEDLASRCRGWWGTARGPSQVAELAARIEHGRPFDVPPSIAASSAPSAAALPTVYDVTAGSTTWSVTVTEKRAIPTIACEAPGGLPAKQSVEYGWAVVERSI